MVLWPNTEGESGEMLLADEPLFSTIYKMERLVLGGNFYSPTIGEGPLVKPATVELKLAAYSMRTNHFSC